MQADFFQSSPNLGRIAEWWDRNREALELYQKCLEIVESDGSEYERMAARLRKAAEGQQRVLFATGHPGGLLDVHRATAAALRAAGCEIVVIPEGLQTDEGYVRPPREIYTYVPDHASTLPG